MSEAVQEERTVAGPVSGGAAQSGITVNFNIGGLPRNVLGVAMVTAWRTPALESVRATLSADAAQYAQQLKSIAQAIRADYARAASENKIGAKYSAAYGKAIHPGKAR